MLVFCISFLNKSIPNELICSMELPLSVKIFTKLSEGLGLPFYVCWNASYFKKTLRTVESATTV